MSDDIGVRLAALSPEERQRVASHPLSSKIGIELILRLLMNAGAMCPKCGYGTRATSKNWARCKKCGERVRRRPLPDIKKD